MKVKDPAHAFGILGLAELTVLKGKPWAVFNKGMQMIVYTDAIESVFFPLEVCYWSVTLYEAKKSLLELKNVDGGNWDLALCY